MVPATANYYFMIGSTFLLTLIGAAVNNWIVEPRLGLIMRRVNKSRVCCFRKNDEA